MATVTQAQPTAPPSVGPNSQKIVGRILIYVVLIAIAIVILLPLVWMVSTSLKPKSQWFSAQIYWIPKTFTLANYERLFNNGSTPIARWFVNSVAVGAAVTVLTLFVDSLAAYAYARLEFPGRKIIFAIMLATLFLPGLMFLVPNFLTIYHIGLLNNYLGVILPGLAGVFGVFFLRQFFETLPKELEEAALIDGASSFQIFYRVVLSGDAPITVDHLDVRSERRQSAPVDDAASTHDRSLAHAVPPAVRSPARARRLRAHGISRAGERATRRGTRRAR